MQINGNRGFSLIELMCVVAIIGILTVIAYPSYQEHIRKTKRVEAQSEILALASRLQQYQVIHHTFLKISDHTSVPISLKDLGHSGVIPENSDPMYDLEFKEITENKWVLVASPRQGTILEGDGSLMINEKNQRCWIKAKAVCSLSNQSNWHSAVKQ
ncbi:type IV pilin protein [Acinetobacter sp. KS-LM10]|uniref:type IV pilin protein n=1 Tax=Acinetobacter sp. KS-LM10 TaxID=3120518 RepID=UPI0030CD0FFE